MCYFSVLVSLYEEPEKPSCAVEYLFILASVELGDTYSPNKHSVSLKANSEPVLENTGAVRQPVPDMIMLGQPPLALILFKWVSNVQREKELDR